MLRTRLTGSGLRRSVVRQAKLRPDCACQAEVGIGWWAIALETVYLDYASLPPTSSRLPRLRSISADDRCQAGPALSTLLGAAPNLEQLELHLDGNIPQALATTDSSNLTNLRSLTFWVNERDCQGLPDPDGTCAFVAGCSAKLESVEFGPFTALEHLGLLEAINSPLKKVVMYVLLEDNMEEEFYVGSVVRDMVDQKAASAVEEWHVDLRLFAGEGWDNPGKKPVKRSEWEDGDWKEWFAMCQERGTELKVTDNL